MIRTSFPARRGQATAVMALLVAVLIGVASVSSELSAVAVADCQLKTIADAAALAGAKQLNDPARMRTGFDITRGMTRARQRAIAIARANAVLGRPGVLLDNPTNSATGDVVVGYKNMAVAGATFDTTVPRAQFNSVRVVARRDFTHGGGLPTFFSKLFGFPGAALTVQSTATVQNYAIAGFKCMPSGYTKLVPITLSKSTYDAMLARQTTDSFTASSNGTVSPGADGLYESSAEPVGSGTGHWCTLRIGTHDDDVAAINNQLLQGVTTGDLASTLATGCRLTLNPAFTVPGKPGLSLEMMPSLQRLIGRAVVVPIFDPATSGGNGPDSTYTIVAFAAVRVLAIMSDGVGSSVLVQPALVDYDPTMTLGAAQRSWSTGGVVRLRLTE